MTKATPGKAQLSNPKLWIGFFGMVLLLAAVTLYATLRQGQPDQKTDQPENPSLDPRQVILQQLGQQQDNIKQTLKADINRHISHIFQPAYRNIGHFADWYYSLFGEYQRILHSLGGDIHKHLQIKVQNLILRPAGLSDQFDALLPQFDARTRQLLLQSKDELLQKIPIQAGDATQPEIQLQKSVNPNALLHETLTLSARDIQRQAVAGLAAIGTAAAITKGFGALVVKNLVTQLTATKSFQLAAVLLSKLAAKAAMKSGGVLTTAAASAAICAPAGPGALVCGAVGGLVAWITVDKIVIEIDESLNREAFEAGIRKALKAQEQELKKALTQAYLQVVNQQFAKLEKSLQPPKKVFVPARRGNRKNSTH